MFMICCSAESRVAFILCHLYNLHKKFIREGTRYFGLWLCLGIHIMQEQLRSFKRSADMTMYNFIAMQPSLINNLLWFR